MSLVDNQTTLNNIVIDPHLEIANPWSTDHDVNFQAIVQLRDFTIYFTVIYRAEY